MTSALAFVTFLLTPPGIPAGGFHWQRIITPPPGAGLREACIVLDAATFANSAPALRDLRLFQDGTELPYVIEESYDERALNTGITPDDDRSEYEPVFVGKMQPWSVSDVIGQTELAEELARSGHHGYYIRFWVDAHVPVERVRIEAAPESAHSLFLIAHPSNPSTSTDEEVEPHTLDADHPAWPFTLGANLQSQAEIFVKDETPGLRTESVVFEMRKRFLCYQPRSTAPLMLYFGGGQGMAAKTYSLANGFSTALKRPYSTMGPLEPNPDLQHPQKRPIPRLLLGIAVLTATLLVTFWVAATFLHKEKGRHMAVPSPSV